MNLMHVLITPRKPSAMTSASGTAEDIANTRYRRQFLAQPRVQTYLGQSLNQLMLFVQTEGDGCPADHLKSEKKAELAGHSSSQNGDWHIPQGRVGGRVQLSAAAVCHIAAIPNAV